MSPARQNWADSGTPKLKVNPTLVNHLVPSDSQGSLGDGGARGEGFGHQGAGRPRGRPPEGDRQGAKLI